MKGINIKPIFLFLLLCHWQLNAMAQLYSSGSETLINSTTSNNQQRPTVSIDSSGNYTVVWESQGQDGEGYGIYRAVYQNDGTQLKSETIVNTTTADDQRFPDVAMNASSEAVVVWQSYNEDNEGWGIYRQKTNDTYGNNGSVSRVNSTQAGRQCLPKVGVDDDLNYIIVWESEGEIFGRLYGDGGGTSVSEFQINTTSSDVQTYPNVAMNGNGDFVVVWQSYNQDGDGFGIYCQRYDNTGTSQGSETLVNSTTANNQTKPSIGIDDSGNFIIIWTDKGADGDAEGIYGQLFNADGTTNGNEFQINTTTSGSQDNADVAMTTSGTFSVVWNSYAQDGQFMGVYNQSYNSDGAKNGAETLVNTTTNYFQQFPAIAIGDAADAVIVWQDGQLNESNSLDTDGYGVVFQRYDVLNIGGGGLPVELLYFYGEQVTEGVQLYWETATEINNSHFDVEFSTDGISFVPNASSGSWKKIGEVAGAGTTNEPQLYAFLHENPVVGENYYRLKQYDFDGKYEYSNIINITIEQSNNSTIRIFPNPATSYLIIETNYQGTVQLFSSTGQFIFEKNITGNTNWDISNLPKGTYFLKMGDAVQRIIKSE